MEHFSQVNSVNSKRVIRSLPILLVIVAALAGCGNKEKKAGQTLASVNDSEITISQLNEELQRANVPLAQQERASKQLLDGLVDRQLLIAAAEKEKLDRDPQVMQAIERAKALILAQSYLQKRVGTVVKPTSQEVEQYFDKHPELFRQRKQFVMRQLVMASNDLNTELKATIDSSKNLDDVASWMEAHKIKFVIAPLTRTSADLPAELTTKLLSISKGQLFIVKEGERSMLMSITDIKDAPVTLDVVAAQIEQQLTNQRKKEAAEAELSRLRAAAKIVYFNKTTGAAEAAAPAAKTPQPAVAPAGASPSASGPADPSVNERGAAGLR